jgi:hypothetical protein
LNGLWPQARGTWLFEVFRSGAAAASRIFELPEPVVPPSGVFGVSHAVSSIARSTEIAFEAVAFALLGLVSARGTVDEATASAAVRAALAHALSTRR